MKAIMLSMFMFLIINEVIGDNVVTVKIDDNVTTDLQTYLSDLHIAVASAQYAANLSNHMVTDLMDKILKNEVNCKCENDNHVDSNGYRGAKEFIRTDYQKTSKMRAHKLHVEPLKWNDARKSCRQEGGELATIDNVDEAQILSRILEDSKAWSRQANTTTTITDKSAFIGIHSHFESNDWTTIRGDPTTRPIDTTTLQDSNCAVLTLQANLKAVRCDEARPYFCQIHAN